MKKELVIAPPEPLGPLTLDQQEWLDHEKRAAANRRAHCCSCGRFVPNANIEVHHHWEYYNEVEYFGRCSSCGHASICWERA